MGVANGASDDEIRKAYRKMALLWHPDKHATNGDDAKLVAEKTFKDISESYEILSDA